MSLKLSIRRSGTRVENKIQSYGAGGDFAVPDLYLPGTEDVQILHKSVTLRPDHTRKGTLDLFADRSRNAVQVNPFQTASILADSIQKYQKEEPSAESGQVALYDYNPPVDPSMRDYGIIAGLQTRVPGKAADLLAQINHLAVERNVPIEAVISYGDVSNVVIVRGKRY